jgi:hypothetical protein
VDLGALAPVDHESASPASASVVDATHVWVWQATIDRARTFRKPTGLRTAQQWCLNMQNDNRDQQNSSHHENLHGLPRPPSTAD